MNSECSIHIKYPYETFILPFCPQLLILYNEVRIYCNVFILKSETCNAIRQLFYTHRSTYARYHISSTPNVDPVETKAYLNIKKFAIDEKRQIVNCILSSSIKGL